MSPSSTLAPLRLPCAPGAAAPDVPAVEALTAAEAAAHRGAWIDLAGRALEPNPFLDPDFAVPAARHLSPRRPPAFVAVWRAGDGGRRLIGLWPVVAGRGGFGLAAGWLHDLSTLGFPLLDRVHGAEALRAILLWAPRGLPRAGGIAVRCLPAGGPTARLLADVARDMHLGTATLAAWDRAVLRHPSAAGRAGLDALSAKSAKEARRQRRRLDEGGALAHRTSGAGVDLEGDIERFLALEAAGWKGAAGTALLLAPGRAGFVRAALPALAERGLCRIEALDRGGSAVAMAVVLGRAGAECLWKIAHDEGASRSSPGVHLVLDITEARRRGPPCSVDSCAVPDHPMIDRLWRDRLAMCDVALALRPGRSPAFALAVAGERRRRRLWAVARRARDCLRGALRRGALWRGTAPDYNPSV